MKPSAQRRRSANNRVRRMLKRLDPDEPVRCHYCQRLTIVWLSREDGPPNTRTYDHVVPWSRGGPEEPWNMVIACRVCNEGRADKARRHRGCAFCARAWRIMEAREAMAAVLAGYPLRLTGVPPSGLPLRFASAPGTQTPTVWEVRSCEAPGCGARFATVFSTNGGEPSRSCSREHGRIVYELTAAAWAETRREALLAQEVTG